MNILDIFRSKGRRAAEKSAASATTIGQMITKFTGLYGLPRDFGFIFHDAAHVMSGLGIGITDELRVIAVEHGLHSKDGAKTYEEALNNVIDAFAMAKAEITSPVLPANLKNGLDNGRAVDAQKASELISRDEIEKLFDIGLKMRCAVRDMTGKNYAELTSHQIAALDFSRVNFAGEVLAVKLQHEIPENRAVAIRLAKALRDAAKAEGGKEWGLQVPRAGTSWVMRVR